MKGPNGENLTHSDICRIFDDVVKEVKASLQAEGRGDELVGAKIICASLRFISVETFKQSAEDCIQLKKEFPHLIAGLSTMSFEINTIITEYAQDLIW